MANCREIRDRFKSFDLYIAVMETIVTHRDDILNYNRSQLMRGYRSDGSRIGAYKNIAYEREKLRMNPEAGGWIDLRYDGDFQLELTLREESKKYAIIYSQDNKYKDLIGRYGSTIFGISDDNKSALFSTGFQTTLMDSVKESLEL